MHAAALDGLDELAVLALVLVVAVEHLALEVVGQRVEHLRIRVRVRVRVRIRVRVRVQPKVRVRVRVRVRVTERFDLQSSEMVNHVSSRSE